MEVLQATGMAMAIGRREVLQPRWMILRSPSNAASAGNLRMLVWLEPMTGKCSRLCAVGSRWDVTILVLVAPARSTKSAVERTRSLSAGSGTTAQS
jgi:hypothetical protein